MLNNDKIRIVFMGTPDFAVPSLDILLQNNFNVVGIITAPDRKAGRGQKIRISPIKKYALEHQLHILQPSNLKDKSFIEDLKALKPDIQVVVAFRMLPEIVWNLPPLGTFNLHASLLPQYRGAAPINWVLINGESETGLTTFLLKKEIDTGDILFQETTEIKSNETAGELHDRLMHMGSKLVLKTALSLTDKQQEVTPIPQSNHEHTKAAPKIFKEDCKINWHQHVTKVYNHIRGLSPYPSAFTILQSPDGINKSLKIFNTIPTFDTKNPAGSISTDGKNFLTIFCHQGALSILELQLEGKRKMSIKDFLKGFKIENGWRVA